MGQSVGGWVGGPERVWQAGLRRKKRSKARLLPAPLASPPHPHLPPCSHSVDGERVGGRVGEDGAVQVVAPPAVQGSTGVAYMPHSA